MGRWGDFNSYEPVGSPRIPIMMCVAGLEIRCRLYNCSHKANPIGENNEN
jgi:hypothetical protein